MRLALSAIWASAAVALLAGFAGISWWASMQSVIGYVATRDGRLSQFVYGFSPYLLTVGLFAVVVALTVHAILWRRSRLTRPAAPSP